MTMAKSRDAVKELVPTELITTSDSESDSEGESNADKNDIKDISKSSYHSIISPWLGCLVWPLLLTVPLVLTCSSHSYDKVFPKSWYEYNSEERPKVLGLFLGIFTVAVGQIFVLIFFYLYKHGYLGPIPKSIQAKGARQYEWSEGVATHFAQPEGFVLLVLYLSITWMLNWMPASYYSFNGFIQWPETFFCLVLQDGIQYAMHRLEHVVSFEFYEFSHKPHHRFTNPRLFDAFNGSMADTIIMILVPLFATAHIVRTCNVWSYMAFGSLYANWLTLIHSEYVLPWDGVFRFLGMGTPGDHHVHHKFFKFNFGHLFMWFDQLGGSYRSPKEFSRRAFHENV